MDFVVLVHAFSRVRAQNPTSLSTLHTWMICKSIASYANLFSTTHTHRHTFKCTAIICYSKITQTHTTSSNTHSRTHTHSTIEMIIVNAVFHYIVTISVFVSVGWWLYPWILLLFAVFLSTPFYSTNGLHTHTHTCTSSQFLLFVCFIQCFVFMRHACIITLSERTTENDWFLFILFFVGCVAIVRSVHCCCSGYCYPCCRIPF